MENLKQEINKILLNESKKRAVTVDKVIDSFLGIGFCQPKFYKPSVWAKAKKIMLFLASMNIGIIHKPYHGKGHFWTNDNLDIIKDMTFSEQKEYFKNKLKDKLTKN